MPHELKDLLKHLEANNCRFVREGGNHTIFKNPETGRMTAIPRHREVKKISRERYAMTLESNARKICNGHY